MSAVAPTVPRTAQPAQSLVSAESPRSVAFQTARTIADEAPPGTATSSVALETPVDVPTISGVRAGETANRTGSPSTFSITFQPVQAPEAVVVPLSFQPTP